MAQEIKQMESQKAKKFTYHGYTYDLDKTIIEVISTDGVRWCYYDIPKSIKDAVLAAKTSNTDFHANLNSAISNDRMRLGLDFCGGGTCNDAQINRRRGTLKQRLRDAGFDVIENRNGNEHLRIRDIIKNS